MMMAAEVPQIDRLIEDGLTLYGQGDLLGALRVWQSALALEPDNAQAASYVDYVRQNYELLSEQLHGSPPDQAADAPFGIGHDEDEYQIEVSPGEVKPSPALVVTALPVSAKEEGWFIDDETATLLRDSLGGRAIASEPPEPARSESDADAPELTFELEAEAPPDVDVAPAIELLPPVVPVVPVVPPTAASDEGISFDDATREYQSQTRRPSAPQAPDLAAASEFAGETTPGFSDANDFKTPPGFGSQATGVRARDLGFVQPRVSTIPGTAPPPLQALGPSTRAALENIELGLPEHEAPAGAEAAPGRSPPDPAVAGAASPDLVSSLPSPRHAPTVPPLAAALPHPLVTTRDFPTQTRPPALATAATVELEADAFAGGVPTRPAPVAPLDASGLGGRTDTVDFEQKTQERPLPLPASHPLVSAPTRDLGLRDEHPAAARSAVLDPDPEPTQADGAPAFDPQDERAARILDEIDHDAPADEEPREDRTRRRITTLFERASQWNEAGELEHAFTAVDLALSEDPSSALAQKLIHRNREIILAVFQAFLGDLERQPQLACPLHELAAAPISPRAAFLLSRVDGQLTIEEILDVCGMPRLEAFRYLCQLFLRGILR